MRFVSNWIREEIKEYQVSKVKTKTINASEVSRKETNKIIGIEILDSKEGGFTLEWNEYPEKQSKFKEWFRRIFKFRIGALFSITYRTSKFGIIEEYLDTSDLEEAIQVIKDQIHLIGNTEKEKEFIETSIDDELIAAKLLKLMNIFHFPYDEEYSVSGETGEIEVSNHFMKENKVPLELIKSLISYDEDTQISEIRLEKKYDQYTYNKIIGETIEKIDQQRERNRNTGKSPVLICTENFWYKVNVKTGWIINAKYEKSLRAKEGGSFEQIEINLKE